jgi:hypothetical protein
MSFGACKRVMPSRTQYSAIIYAAAACVNLREELLAFQASLPMCGMAIVSWMTRAWHFLFGDLLALPVRKSASVAVSVRAL